MPLMNGGRGDRLPIALGAMLIVLVTVATIILVQDAGRPRPAQQAAPANSPAAISSQQPTPQGTPSDAAQPDNEPTAEQRRELNRVALKRARRMSCEEPGYQIGFQGPLSGEFSGLGHNMVNGVELALSQANRGQLTVPSGRLLPRELSLVLRPIDTKGDAT